MIETSINTANNVCVQTVKQDLCIGCGVCAGICPAGNLVMEWTASGCYQPADRGHCIQACHRCLDVCPFQDHEENEDTLAAKYFGDIDGIHHTPEIGYYLQSFVGYANGNYRERGASGGVTSWMLTALLRQNQIDGVVCVLPSVGDKQLFQYSICRSPQEIMGSARSVYYPVELSEVLSRIRKEPGRYAVTCLPCVAKALRLACLHDPILKERITFIIGLACGQNKSRLFTEYCAAASGGKIDELSQISFREKIPDEYSKMSFKCSFGENGTRRDRYVRGWQDGFGKVWSNCAFTLRPCLFCDDVFAETADAVLMDAWLPEYDNEWLGTNIVLLRNPSLLELILAGLKEGELLLSYTNIQQVIASQYTQLANKRRAILARLRFAKRSGSSIPSKRTLLCAKPTWVESAHAGKQLRIQSVSAQLWLERKSREHFLYELAQLEKLPWYLELAMAVSSFSHRISRLITLTGLRRGRK